MKGKPLPKEGDRINLDPNRDEPDNPIRWTNPNRKTAVVVRVFESLGDTIIVYAYWRSGRGWRHELMTKLQWECWSWEIGPLPKPPKGEA